MESTITNLSNEQEGPGPEVEQQKGSMLVTKPKKSINIVYGKRTKICDAQKMDGINCGAENAVARKSCCDCGQPFAKKIKKPQDYVSAGKINPTIQKNIIHGRMLGLNQKENVHSFIFYIKKGERNISLDTFATPGFALELVGSRDNLTEVGQSIANVMRNTLKGISEQDNVVDENVNNSLTEIIGTELLECYAERAKILSDNYFQPTVL